MRRNDERGVVALAAAVIISILLLVVVTGLIRVMLSEKRQSTDSDQSAKAYYAAESGAEVALQNIRKQLASTGTITEVDTCPDPGTPPVAVGNTGFTGYTCALVTTTTDAVAHDIAADSQPMEIDLPNVDFDSIQIDWNDTSKLGGGNIAAWPGGTAPFSNQPSGWNYPAVLELSEASYPSGSSTLAASSIAFNQQTLVPTSNSATATTMPYNGNIYSTCSTSSAVAPYACTATIKNFKSDATHNRYILRLRARYAGTSYRIRFFDSTGTLVNNIPDQMAKIDVTAQSGDVYRRVIQFVPIQNGLAQGLDYVLFSEKDICKNMVSIAGNVTDSGGCPF